MNSRLVARVALVAALTASGCGASGTPGGRTASTATPDVQVWGKLHAVMMENDTAAVVSLATLTPDSTLWALGAAAGLAGEITVVGGNVWRAIPGEGDEATTTVSRTSDAQAALLVAARVPAWRDVPIEDAIPFDSLEARVAALAAGAGFDADRAFPFVIEGPLRDLQWHVVDGRRLAPGAGGHAAHLEASAHGQLDHVSAGLIGFYSTAHEGVFTHRGAYTHVHVVIPAARASGHLDHVIVEPGATLRLPAS